MELSSSLLLAPYLLPPSNLRFLLFLLLLLHWPDARDERYCSLYRCTGALSPLKPELKKTHVDDWCAAQTDSQNACDISSAPLTLDGLERRSSWSGKALGPRGGFTHKHDRRGPNGQLPSILDRQRLPRTLCDHVRSASALSALKKSLVANLSAKRQLSVANLSTNRIFSLAKRDFLVANGRMAADFSSPACEQKLCTSETEFYMGFYFFLTIFHALLFSWYFNLSTGPI